MKRDVLTIKLHYLRVLGIVIVSLFYTNCISTKNIVLNENVSWYNDLKINDLEGIEDGFDSKDVSKESNTVGFGIHLYPNEKDFKLNNPKKFVRKLDDDLPLEVFYQFSEDGINRLILYEWDAFTYSINNEQKIKRIKKCNLKFIELYNVITLKFGEPKENETTKSGTRSVRWKNESGMNAYLVYFTPGLIRLSLYNE
jgi:hypothetical protein